MLFGHRPQSNDQDIILMFPCRQHEQIKKGHSRTIHRHSEPQNPENQVAPDIKLILFLSDHLYKLQQRSEVFIYTLNQK